MPKDKFKVIRSEVVESDPNDPLKDLKEAASVLLDVAKVNSSEQLDKDLNRTAIIEIDGNIVWNSRDEDKKMEALLQAKRLGNSEAQKTEIEQRIAMLQRDGAKKRKTVTNAFKKLARSDQNEKTLFNLHQGVMASAWLMLNNHYCLNLPDGTKIKGMLGISDKLKELKMKRENEVFSYELTAPAYAILNVEDGSWWGIGLDGTAQMVDEPDGEALKAQGYKPICEISVVAKLDLSRMPHSKPISSFELEVQSQRAELRYTGPKKAPEVLQVENVDLSLQERLKRAFSSIKFKGKRKESEENITPLPKKSHTEDKKAKNQKTPFQFSLLKQQEKLANKFPEIIVGTLAVDDHCKGGIKIEIPAEDNNEFLNYFQNDDNEVESNLPVNPSYKAIAILFELNEKTFPLAMETCGNLDSLLKLYKASKYTNQKIEFSTADLTLLESSAEYQKFHKLDIANFRRYLQEEGELTTFIECFERKKNRSSIVDKRKSILFDTIAPAHHKERKKELKEEPNELSIASRKTPPKRK